MFQRGGALPELPDIVAYLDALDERIRGKRLERIRLASPFLVRTVDPPMRSVEGQLVRELRRVGKRIAIGFDDGKWMVLHLMIAGRLHWRNRGAKLAGKPALAAFDFNNGTLVLTEASSTKRASLHVLRDEDALRAMDPGGLEVIEATIEAFSRALTSANHTLKRAITDPRRFSGIGNAYSDEILHRARLSPVALTQKLNGEEIQRLYDAARETLTMWMERLRRDAREQFPEKVTAFREGMAVHGRYGQPCPVCGEKIRRIRYAANETNYCPRCQTGGRLLADRSLSRLLKQDWPRTVEEWETRTKS